MITLLSIDGGGVRGIIPATILEFIEEKLQNLDGEHVRIADYFDIIAGTSTGGLVSAMLTVPSPYDQNRPRFAAKDITKFYLDTCASIFPPPKKGICGQLQRPYSALMALMGPKYGGDFLSNIIKKYVGDVQLDSTLTNVVIPVYDLISNQPIVFSTFQARRDESRNPLLSDVLIGTSAAPTYFPAHSFQTHGPGNNPKRFNLIDGGVAANDPTFVAINNLIKEGLIRLKKYEAQNLRNDSEYWPLRQIITSLQNKKDVYSKFRVLSLGTGQERASYKATDAAKWGQIRWLKKGGRTPLVEVFMKSSAHVTDILASLQFQGPDSNNYLRIQELELHKEKSSMDLSTKDNLVALKQTGNNLLDKPVLRMNLESETYESVPGGSTNRDALTSFCKTLSGERRSRQKLSKTIL